LFEAVSFVRSEEKRPPCEIDAVAFQLLSYFFHKLSVRTRRISLIELRCFRSCVWIVAAWGRVWLCAAFARRRVLVSLNEPD
jgi:hypothetical protein